MTVMVGYLPHKGGRGSLDLGLQLAHVLRQRLVVVTVVPRQWSTPSLARVDAEYVDHARQVGEQARASAREYVHGRSVDVEITHRTEQGRSSSSALVRAAADLGASMLVLGSSAGAVPGRITVGSTTDKLLHSAPIPLALAPRGYRSHAVDGVPRVTCAFSDNAASAAVVAQVAGVARRVGAPLRVASFGIRGATMYPPEVGLSAEDSVLAGWREQVRAAQRRLVERGVVDGDVDRVIGSGAGWGEALSGIDWIPTEVLALGSSTVGPAARVFLGSRAAKIIRHAPVPVIVLPAGRSSSSSPLTDAR